MKGNANILKRAREGKCHTREQIIEYHILKGQEKKFFQFEKIRQLKEFGFKITKAGLISFPNGKPMLKPKYIWIRFNMGKFLRAIFGDMGYCKILGYFPKIESKVLQNIMYKLLYFRFDYRIDWHEQINIFKDWNLKFLIVMNKEKTKMAVQKFPNFIEFVGWQSKYNLVDYDMSVADEFSNNPNLFLSLGRYILED